MATSEECRGALASADPGERRDLVLPPIGPVSFGDPCRRGVAVTGARLSGAGGMLELSLTGAVTELRSTYPTFEEAIDVFKGILRAAFASLLISGHRIPAVSATRRTVPEIEARILRHAVGDPALAVSAEPKDKIGIEHTGVLCMSPKESVGKFADATPK